MNIPINENLTWKEPVLTEKTAVVSCCSVGSINCVLVGGKLEVMTVYRLLDVAGKEVRRGVDRQTEDKLRAAIGGAFDALRSALAGLMDASAVTPSVVLQVRPDGTLTAVCPRVSSGPAILTEAQLDSSLQSCGGVAALKKVIESLGTATVTGR